MTVHGAKGLEAPIVILADATADPVKLGRTPLTVDIEISGAGSAPLLRPRKNERCPPFDRIIEAEEKSDLEEHNRLLYVALTRAADRLIVSGVRPKQKSDGSDPRPANCWHRIVEQAMAGMNGADAEGHVAMRYASQSGSGSKRRRDKLVFPPSLVPAWAKRAAPLETRPPRPLSPSQIAIDDESAPPPSEAMRKAAQRGTWIHQLLELLPALGVDERPAAADRWLERCAAIVEPNVRHEIVDQVCGVLSDRSFAEIFGDGSLPEVPLAATLPDGRVIAGTVDRIRVETDQVLVIDFKTGRVPGDETEIPNSHHAQMTAYAEALQVIFPGRRVRAALLYTAGPRLFELTS